MHFLCRCRRARGGAVCVRESFPDALHIAMLAVPLLSPRAIIDQRLLMVITCVIAAITEERLWREVFEQAVFC